MILARSENVIANLLANAIAILLKIWSINSWVCLHTKFSSCIVLIHLLPKGKNMTGKKPTRIDLQIPIATRMDKKPMPNLLLFSRHVLSSWICPWPRPLRLLFISYNYKWIGEISKVIICNNLDKITNIQICAHSKLNDDIIHLEY
jgi:hypothetical protein